jgi:murein DD-endopeptidase MepM/ murein hydrolase activator NlpD
VGASRNWPRKTPRRIGLRLRVVAAVALASATVLTAILIGLRLGTDSPAESSSETAVSTKDGAVDYDVLSLRARERAALPPRSVLGSDVPARTATPAPASTATPAAALKWPFVWPADGWITQRMWAGHPKGIDIGVPTGSPVRAVRAGRVTFAGGNPCCSYGYYVIVQHDGGWTSLYGHLSAFAVKTGDQVARGQRLGLSGATGYASGPHLHFELRYFGTPVDPLPRLPARANLYIAPDEVPQASLQPPPAAPQQPPATPTPQPPALDAGLSAGQAIALAAQWMTGATLL